MVVLILLIPIIRSVGWWNKCWIALLERLVGSQPSSTMSGLHVEILPLAFSPHPMEDENVAVIFAPTSACDSRTSPNNGDSHTDIPWTPPHIARSELRPSQDTQVTNTPLESQENPAPLLDSRVFIFCTRSSTDDLDFSCAGHREPVSHEGQTRRPGRPRAWSDPYFRQSTTVRLHFHDGAESDLAGLGPRRALVGKDRRSSAVPTVGYMTSGANGCSEARRAVPHHGRMNTGRKRLGARASNKWGDHPPAGYF